MNPATGKMEPYMKQYQLNDDYKVLFRRDFDGFNTHDPAGNHWDLEVQTTGGRMVYDLHIYFDDAGNLIPLTSDNIYIPKKSPEAEIMIIKMNEMVKISEFAEIFVKGAGNESRRLKVELTFSKEALIGFATNLLWMYDDINAERKLHIHVDPLLGSVTGNQALGFFLTPQSPPIILSVNSVDSTSSPNTDLYNFQEIFIKHRFVKEFELKEPAIDESIEEYELGFNNIAQVRILDLNDAEVTNEKMQIVFNINYIGLKDFATMLLILANNYENGLEYKIAHAGQNEKQYNMGILLSEKSNELILKCDYLGCVYNYAPEFGTV